MSEPSIESALADLAARFWQFQCYELPLTAILAGQETPDNVLFRESPEDHNRRYTLAGKLLAELNQLSAEGLTGQALATHRLLRHELEMIRRSYETASHLRPSLFPVGPDFNTIYFANSQNLEGIPAAERYLARLATIPAFLRDLEVDLRAGYASGIRYPRHVLDRGLATTRASTSGPVETSALYGPIKRSASAAKSGFAAIAARAQTLIREHIYPAFAAYGELLAGPLAVGARETIACTDAPGGREFYQALVRQFTTTTLGPDEIHRIGLNEVARLDAEVEGVAAAAGFSGDVAGYRRFLASDAQFVAGSKEQLREKLEILCKRIDRRIPTFFGRIPRTTYGVELIPEALAAGLPPAYAQPNPADGGTSGIFWLTSLPERCPSYLHVPLALHEGWPGHLMHIALIQEMDGLPAFRRYGAVKYTACVEGWALYCETLGVDLGLYETPHQNYGRLEFEMWRAVRLVLDTGIHWHDWDRSRAIDYMAAHLALPRPTIESEVDRYIALPGQALAYQLGNLRIRTLRNRAEATLGERFSLRAFHDELMSIGAVTLPVLEGLMDSWIASRRTPH